MTDFFAAILEVIAEALLEVFGELLISLLARTIGKLLAAIFEPGPLGTAVVVMLLGVVSGACSVVVFPHPLVHPSKVHGISLIVSPVIAGLVMSQVGRFLRNRGKRTIQLESFVYGFTFAFAMAVVRLLFVR
jgi:hypothetical protein